MCIDTIISLPEENLSKPKYELVTKLEVEHEKYISNVKDSKTSYEELVVKVKADDSRYIGYPHISGGSR